MLLCSILVARALNSELKGCDLNPHTVCTSFEAAPTIRLGEDRQPYTASW